MDHEMTAGPSTPFELLGLTPDASPDEIVQARRRMAKAVHPDHGGEQAAMQRLNTAFDEAMAIARSRGTPSDRHSRSDHQAPQDERGTSRLTADGPSGRLTADGLSGRLTADGPSGRLTADHPSFTIEALPVVAHAALGEVLDGIATVVADDPPYLIEVEWLETLVSADAPPSPIGWSRLELFPDAGSTSVSLTLGSSILQIESVRNLLIARLNALDWSQLMA